ncbi:hypothetical protein NIG5292_02790 [Nereida ignava]|uniref:Uncharacterized protein n=1 Tax=Nereida ignava TaxID=282199 RepID=A0A0U1NPQ4_9RHOB|nr:hypothetical protein NIG5292_02790 [Nereida ignava]
MHCNASMLEAVLSADGYKVYVVNTFGINS